MIAIYVPRGRVCYHCLIPKRYECDKKDTEYNRLNP